ncbi:MAG: hypothetical protein J5643_08125 [Lachnospiraceae bacterium]|nr:hypothetical protein [Lachnospiraceae bacterium]
MDILTDNELLRTYIGTLSYNLFGTLAIEIPLALALGVRGRKNAWTVFEVNVLTNPIVVTILFLLVRTQLCMPAVRGILFLMECVVVPAEGMLYKRRLTETPMNPFKLSLILNAVSYGTGVILELISVL